MLESVIRIGRTFREAGRINQHRYISAVYNPRSKSEIKYISIPVSESLKFGKPVESIDETTIHKKLFYLTYQTSDSDSVTKTLFGDVYKFLKKDKDGKPKEGGNYRSKRRSKVGSFERANPDAAKIGNETINLFRAEFLRKIDLLEDLLDSAENVYLHFDFSGKQWYELPGVLDAINQQLAKEFASVNHADGRYTFDKTLYRSICSGDEKNDIQFPEFDASRKYRSAEFTEEEMKDLFYGINYSEYPLVRIYKTPINIVVLPRGEHIGADDLERFAQRDLSEESLRVQQENFDLDRLFSPFLFEVPDSIMEFDVLFCKSGTNVNADVLDIPSVERSHLREIHERIRKASLKVEGEQKQEVGGEPQRKELIRSFYSIFGGHSQKYQRHIFKVLPQIYQGTYRRDPLILSAFVEKVEYDIRNRNPRQVPSFNYLKYDYYFLIDVQTSNGGATMEEMLNSNSYKAGLLLGKLAKPLDWKIASFEKNYVGLLSRRIADKEGLVRFKTFIDEKLAIHDVAYPELKAASVELANLIAELADSEYNKNYCAFGFFESYYKFQPKADTNQTATSTIDSTE